MNRDAGHPTIRPAPRRLWARAATGLLALALASCAPSHPDRVALSPGRGRVLYDGRPAAGVELRLYPDPPRADGLTPLARTRDDGTFALTTYEGEDGAPPGRYAVGLRWPEGDAKVLSGPKPDRLEEKYRDPARTPWRVEIARGDNALKDIEIAAAPAPGESAKKATGRAKASKSHDGPRSPGAAKAGVR